MVVQYSRHTQFLPNRVKIYLLVVDLTLRKDRLNVLTNLLVICDMQSTNQVFYEVFQNKTANSYSSIGRGMIL